MLEAGLGEHWKKRYWPSNRKCDNVKRSVGPKSLSLADLQGAFLILAIGSGSAFVVFLIEGIVLILHKFFFVLYATYSVGKETDSGSIGSQ